MSLMPMLAEMGGNVHVGLAALGAALGVALQGVEGDVQGDSNVAVQGAWASLRLGIGVFKP